MRSGNLGCWSTGGLDLPPLGERECMHFHRKSIDSEVLDEVPQSRLLADRRLRSTPIRGAKMYAFSYEIH